MTRADELTLKLADGLIEPAERSELEALVADPTARARFLSLLDFEGILRSRRHAFNVAAPVLEKIGHMAHGRTEAAVLARLKALPDPAWRRRPVWSFAAAAAVLFAAVLALSLGRSAPPAARLVQGNAVREVRFGEPIRTGEAERAVVEFLGEATRIEIEARSEIVLHEDASIELRLGEIEADVAPRPRPLRILAPNARAEVLGTRLKLSAASDATRLEVTEGRVRFTREPDGATVEVSARHYTVAEANTTLVAHPIRPIADVPTAVVRFSLIQLDTPRAPIPGYEALEDGAVINLAALPTRRVNLQAHTDPKIVGSLRWAWNGNANHHTEFIHPYTLVPNSGNGRRTWDPLPGVHTVTATPFTGTYGNGLRGASRTLNFRVIDE